jgi:hypothetical protein
MHKTVSIEKQSRPSQVLLQLGELYKRHCKFDEWVRQDMTNPGLTGREIKRLYGRKCLKKTCGRQPTLSLILYSSSSFA